MDQTEKVRHVIYFPSLVQAQAENKPKNKGNVEYLSLKQLEERGKNANIGLNNDILSPPLSSLSFSFSFSSDEQIYQTRPKKDDIAVIMYTSGSTGTPKGHSSRPRKENIFLSLSL